ncbi:MAG TPA: hypothetical protein VHM23_24635 [Actinomycetota bacterium]|jgi:hypothetical protein|nr:hypothetical protein [Actinomycetota bacterium]
MSNRQQEPWGERLAAEGAAAADEPSLRRLLGDAVGVVMGRLGEVGKVGIRPLLDEAAAQVRPASLEELRARYPDLPDDEVARRLIDRAARTAAGLALLVGGVIAAQQAMTVASAAAPPVAGTTLGSIGVTALAEVLALFVVEAKLRADLGALAGQPVPTPRELAANVLGDVQAAGGWKAVRGRSMRRALPDAAVRRAAARLAAMVPARFARIVIPEVVAPLIGSAVAARLASRQVRAGGEQHWGRLRTTPGTAATWGPPVTPNGGRPPTGWHPSGWGPPPGDEPRQLPPPPDR